MFSSKEGAAMVDSPNENGLDRYTGRWVAWNREQTRIVASGDTFEALKSEAAERGEHSILVAHVPQKRNWHLLRVFAVFIAFSQPIAVEPPGNEPSASIEIASEGENSQP